MFMKTTAFDLVIKSKEIRQNSTELKELIFYTF